MKVLINAASAERGGIVTYTQNLISYMLQRGIDVKVAAPSGFTCSDPSVLVPVRAARYAPLQRVAWEQIVWRRQVKKLRPDVLFSSANFGLLFSPVPQVLLMREGGLFDRYYLSHSAAAQGVRIMAKRYFRRRMMLLSMKHADHIITPSVAMRDNLLQWAPEVAEKSSTNFYGARHDLFTEPATDKPWRKDGTLRLLYVSVYYPHKCPSMLCRAADRLSAGGMPTVSTITMTQEELRITPGAAYDRRVMTRALEDGTLTLGHHPYSELPTLYRSHDVFVFPSVSETFGHPMVEAMASGLPIVAADTAINREICGDGAIYFAPFSVEDLSRQLRRLDDDAELRRAIAANARRRVSAEFNWEDHVDRLVRVFETVRRKSGPARGQ